ncbi:hypothetical protein PENTCL1PPCAC_13474, partial [Pristionchus entomophagus]
RERERERVKRRASFPETTSLRITLYFVHATVMGVPGGWAVYSATVFSGEPLSTQSFFTGSQTSAIPLPPRYEPISRNIWSVGQLTAGSATEGTAEHGSREAPTLISHRASSAGFSAGQTSGFGVAGMPGDVGSIRMQPRLTAVRAERRSSGRVNNPITGRVSRLMCFSLSFLFNPPVIMGRKRESLVKK